MICSLAMAGAGLCAHAEVQSNDKGDTAKTTITGLTVDDILAATTQASGNVLVVDADKANVTYANQVNRPPSGSAMSATTTIDDILASGSAKIATQAQGNIQQLHSAGALSVLRDDPTQAFQATTSGAIVTATAIGQAKSGAFTDLDVSSLATGNGLVATSDSGPVALGFAGNDQQGLIAQTNQASEHASLTLNDVSASGKLTGLAQATGNVVSTVLESSGGLGSGFNVSQTNTVDQFALATMTDTKVAGTGGSFGASAVGNAADFGAANDGVIRQLNTANASAQTTLTRATINGAVSAQAVGDALSFASDTQATLVSQKISGAQTARIDGKDVVINGDTSFTAVALGNHFTGTNAPGIAPGAFWQQEATGAGQTASITLDKGSGDGSATFQATAVGNLADLTNPEGFLQNGNTPTSATVSVTNTSFSGGMTSNTTTMANMVVVH